MSKLQSTNAEIEYKLSNKILQNKIRLDLTNNEPKKFYHHSILTDKNIETVGR